MSNLPPYENNVKQEGTAREARYTEALNPQSILVDGRKLEDYLAYAQQYTSNLLFVATSDNSEVTTWDSFYRNEPAFLMARIATKDPVEIKAVYDTLMRKFESDKSMDSFGKVAAFVFSRFEKIDRWYASLHDNPLRDELALYIRSYLAFELKKLQDILKYLHTLRQDNHSFTEKYTLQNKNNIWEIANHASAIVNDNAFSGSNEAEKLTNASIVINAVFEVVFYTTKSIISYCKNYFQTSIFHHQDHQPHVALFIAFIKLLGYQQEELNKLPRKLLDYYYKDVLHIKAKKAVPDQAFILFEMAKGFDQFKIDKDSLLTAGKDKTNKELLYKTDKDIIVNKAKVQALKTLQIANDEAKVLGIYADTIKKGEDKKPVQDASGAFPIFGKKEHPVAIGFAIASTQFYLAKGERNVSIIFELKDAVRHDVFDTTIFNLRFTGEKGWMDSAETKDYIAIKSLKKAAERTLVLEFCISIAQASGVIAFNPKVHTGNFRTAYPVMQFLLQFPKPLPTGADAAYEARIEQLNELLSLRVSSVAVKVEAGSMSSAVSFNGVTDLLVENHESVLDIKKPFYPFTAMPKVGSSVYIGCSDLYYKPVQKFSLNIEWLLPDNFRSYYEKYFPPYDANKFRATLSILKEKKWQKIKDVSIIETTEAEGKFRSLRVDFNKTDFSEEENETEKNVSKFDTSKEDGTLRLKLLYPDFGHDIYPQLITSTVLEKSSSKSATVDFYKIIKKQLYDSVISIKLPDDINNRAGSLRVVIYEILEKIADDQRARTMMINGLMEKLKEFNGSDIVSQEIQEAASRELNRTEEGENKMVVNDDRFISRILYFLKKVRLIDNSIHFDRDKQDVEDVVLHLKEKMNTRSTHFLPAHWELAELIVSEINSAINQIVIRIVEEILLRRKTAMPDAEAVAAIMKSHVDEANEVINDMIARKIAILLSANDIPPKPYTPQINTIAINYLSTKDMESEKDQFFHILPFGTAEINPFAVSKKTKEASKEMLFTNHLFPFRKEGEEGLDSTQSGQFLIGLSDVVAGQNLTLFFEFAEGSKKNDSKPALLSWWYLQYNQWRLVENDLLVSDSTYGLQTTGIVEISIPEGTNNEHTVFENETLSWLCVSVSNGVESFPGLIDVRAQAITVTFQNNDNDPGHFALPLPPKKIKAFTQAMPGIKAVRQPVASLHGKMQEENEEYFTRVSERLRHKQRAVNNWDYERLILEEFPFVYKVNCINNYCRNKYAPGHVTVVPIVNLKNKGDENIDLQPPRASYWDLRKMESYLNTKTSPFVKLHAVNPGINKVLVRCKVRLRNGKDRGFYLRMLNDELVCFLTPWAARGGEVLSFSAKVYLSSIISFIDSKDYVEFVTGMEMNQYKEDEYGNRIYSKAANGTFSLFETVTIAPHEILASSPQHHIELL